MKRDLRLEKISDHIRRGEIVSIGEAMEVIQYQADLKRARKEKTWLERLSSIFSFPSIGE